MGKYKHESRLSFEAENSVVEPSEVKNEVEVIAPHLNVRYLPNDEIIGVANKGDKFEYNAVTPDGWYCIDFNGKTGWVMGEYCKVAE